MTGLGHAAKGHLFIFLIALLLVGLPIAVWLDLSDLVEANLRRQASDVNSIISSVRHYYANNVVGRILASPGSTKVVHNYRDYPGAIPIPATLSLELGKVVGEQQKNIKYRFVSDYPFENRAPHAFDEFETDALSRLRQNSNQQLTRISSSIFSDGVRLIAPVIMDQPCVNCHNSHPESPKTDWKVGDVRGIQEVSISQPIAGNIFAFKYLLAYFGLTAAVGTLFITMQRRQAATISGMNAELEAKNDFLHSLSTKISRYLSPQIYRSIFSGQKDVTVHTERKKLTIFFSDIQDFTATTERLQPEQITQLLNEYFTEMSRIAHPFQARIGINSGYCNVGNFGSSDRMDYTIIGAEANLAARLQSIAEPGGIVLSYETFMLVRDMVRARPLEPITLKGIAHPVVPYAVEGSTDGTRKAAPVISKHDTGLDLFIDTGAIDASAVERVRRKLENVVAELKLRSRTAEQN